MSRETIPLTILGAGYVGQALWRRYPAATTTRRRATASMPAFDLHDSSTWDAPPLAQRAIVWTFPAEPVARVQSFYETHLKKAAGLIVLGSTSAYLANEGAPSPVMPVTERTPLDLTQPRAQGEEWLRQQGATVLQLAGIFGPGRDPADWLRKGLIKDGAKLVNLIHVDDIIAVIAHLLTHPMPGERINVTNGEPLPWRELATRLRQAGRLPADFALPATRPDEHGKRIDNGRLRRLLPDHDFQRP